jgi:DNA-binding transcriptional LysR family regulator
MKWTDRIGRRIKLRDLHILQAVAQTGSMGRAATELAVSQPVVSKAIAELEHALGVRLLDRSAKGIELTVYGHAIMQCSVSVFDELRQGLSTLEFLTGAQTGELRIGCTDAGAAGFVPTAIDRFSRQHPRVAFHVVTADAAALVERELRQRRIELAIGATPAMIPGGDVDVDFLFEDQHVVVAGAKSKWVRRRSIPLKDLLSEPWILPPADSASGQRIIEAFHAAGLEPPRAQVAAFSIPLYHQLLATGRYVTMLPITMARLGGHLQLKPLNVRFGGIPRSVAVMTVKNRTLSPLATAFIACVREMAIPFAKTHGAIERFK